MWCVLARKSKRINVWEICLCFHFSERQKMFHTLEYHFKITKYLYGIGLKNLVCVGQVWSRFGRCGADSVYTVVWLFRIIE